MKIWSHTIYFLCSLDCYLLIMIGSHDPGTEVIIMNSLTANLYYGMVVVSRSQTASFLLYGGRNFPTPMNLCDHLFSYS